MSEFPKCILVNVYFHGTQSWTRKQDEDDEDEHPDGDDDDDDGDNDDS